MFNMFFFSAEEYHEFFKTYLNNTILNFTEYVKTAYFGLGSSIKPECQWRIVTEIAEFHNMYVVHKYETKETFPGDVEKFLVVDPAKLYVANRTKDDPQTLAECNTEQYSKFCKHQFTYSSIFNLQRARDALTNEYLKQFELNFQLGLRGNCQVYEIWRKHQLNRKRTPGRGLLLEEPPTKKSKTDVRKHSLELLENRFKNKIGEYYISLDPPFDGEDIALFLRWQEEKYDAWGVHPKGRLYEDWCTQEGHTMNRPPTTQNNFLDLPTLSPIPPTHEDLDELMDTIL